MITDPGIKTKTKLVHGLIAQVVGGKKLSKWNYFQKVFFKVAKNVENYKEFVTEWGDWKPLDLSYAYEHFNESHDKYEDFKAKEPDAEDEEMLSDMVDTVEQWLDVTLPVMGPGGEKFNPIRDGKRRNPEFDLDGNHILSRAPRAPTKKAPTKASKAKASTKKSTRAPTRASARVLSMASIKQATETKKPKNKADAERVVDNGEIQDLRL